MTGGGYFPGRYFPGRYFAERYFPNGIEEGAGLVAPALIASTVQVFGPGISRLTISPSLIVSTAHVFGPEVRRLSVEPGLIAASTQVFAPEVSLWVPVTVYIGGGTELRKPKRSFVEQDFEFRWQIQRSVEEAFAFASSIRGLVDTTVETAWFVEGGIPIEAEMAAAWYVQDLDQRTKNERNMRFLLAEMDEDLAEVLA